MNIFKCAIPGSKHSSSIFASCGIGNYGGPWWPMLVPLSNEEDHKLYFFFLLHQNHGLASQLTPSVCSLWPIMVTMQFVHKYPFAYRLCPGHKFHHFIPTSNFTSAYFWTSPGTGKCKSPVHYKMILRHPWNEERSSSVAPSAAAESRRSLRQYFFFFFGASSFHAWKPAEAFQSATGKSHAAIALLGMLPGNALTSVRQYKKVQSSCVCQFLTSFDSNNRSLQNERLPSTLHDRIECFEDFHQLG